MPIYEYACCGCGNCFEELVRNAGDESALACPACGAGNPERRLSACAVRMGSDSGAADTSLPAKRAPGGCGGGGFT